MTPAAIPPLIEARHSWAPHDRLVQALLKALFQVNVTVDYPRWKEYRDHLDRRNDIAHRGQEVDPASARASIEVVTDLWLWLTREVR